MFCAYCGKSIAQDSQYCPHCGKPMTSAVQSDTSKSANQQRELTLLQTYDQELVDFRENVIKAARAGKEDLRRGMSEYGRRVEIYENQVQNCARLFPDDSDIRFYEARVQFFKGVLKSLSGIYRDSYGGMFSPTMSDEMRSAITFFERSLQISEHIGPRAMKVFCYRQLGDKKSALQELDYILEHYEHHEDAYLKARKEKDELEAPSASGIGRVVRSIFG